MLLDAVASSMLAALESHRIETALRGARTDAVHAAQAERPLTERDLHGGAQQRLLALRIKLG